jgi:predicted NBD/HSP70 family sugar kinase
VDAAALAERALGHGRDVDSFAFVHVGTGIGMGLVLGGRLHRGVHGVAGEIAFMPLGDGVAGYAEADPGAGAEPGADAVAGLAGDLASDPASVLASDPDADPDADPEEARRRGTLETAAAADGIARAASRAGMRGPITARSVFEAAADGDPRAAGVVAAEARLVASAICCVITVIDPALIVLGGGIGQAPGFASAVKVALAATAPVLPEVKVSALGTEVVVDGCLAEGASLAWNQLVAALP